MLTDLLIYLLKASVILAVTYLFFHWVLSRYTYFRLNRWVLLVQMVFVFSLPLIQLPLAWHPFTDESAENAILDPYKSPQAPAFIPEFNPSFNALTDSSDSTITLDWPSIFTVLYLIGVLGFFIRMFLQILSLAKLQRKAIRIEKHPAYQLVWCKESISPFSFFNRIFLPEQKLEPEVLTQIIQHEAIHVRQKHSWDIFLAEILIVILWFNPFAWLYRRAIESNLEFLTDQNMLASGISRKNYMLHLLNLSLPDWKARLGLTYNQSLLQKRIAMMNAKISKPKSRWSYVVWIALVPLFTFCNEPIMTDWVAKSRFDKPVDLAVIITEDARPEELQQLKQAFDNLNRDCELEITHLEYGSNGKISAIYPLLRFDDKEPSGTGYYADPNVSLKPVCIMFSQNERVAARFLRESDMDELVKRYNEIQFLTAGMKSSKAAIRDLRDNLGSLKEKAEKERVAELEKNDWKQKRSGWITYSLNAQASWENIEKRARQTNAPEVWYIVDEGAKQATRPDIPLNQIQEIKFEYVSIGYYNPETYRSDRTEETETRVHILTR